MFDRVKRHSAIKSYFMKLSLELFSRFGKKHYYTVDEVSHTAEAAGFKTEHLAYALALFCARKDFRRHHKRTPFRDRYEALRDEVSVQYFGGVRDFDAANIIDAVRHFEIDPYFYESGEGFSGVFTH
jgi:hypothetical protein